MNIAICDDEDYYLKVILSHLMKYNATHQNISLSIDTFRDSKNFMNEFMKKGYDLVYLDIEINDVNGMNIAQMIHNMNPECIIIFITNHMKYFNESFIVNAFQYMHKPIKEKFLISELERAIKRTQEHTKSVVFHTTEGNIVFDTKEIIYIETAYREYKVHSTKGAFYGTIKSIQSIKETLLDYNFYKIQRSFIVNLEHIERFDSTALTMSNGDVLPVSKKKYKEFKEVFFRFIDS